ncbi:MAG: OsmC family protein [Armatimonadota bacterium]|nr:OsmC family protein [Armatimonadota bacterium]
MPEAKVTLVKGMTFRGESGSGHTVMMDSAKEFGGMNAGVRPMEMLLLALGGCTAMDVITILRKKRQDVTGYEVRVSGERASEHPRVFTDITVEHIVRGKGVDPAAVERAVELSTSKYCSVIGMLGKVADIRTSFRVVEDRASVVSYEASAALRAGQGNENTKDLGD